MIWCCPDEPGSMAVHGADGAGAARRPGGTRRRIHSTNFPSACRGIGRALQARPMAKDVSGSQATGGARADGERRQIVGRTSVAVSTAGWSGAAGVASAGKKGASGALSLPVGSRHKGQCAAAGSGSGGAGSPVRAGSATTSPSKACAEQIVPTSRSGGLPAAPCRAATDQAKDGTRACNRNARQASAAGRRLPVRDSGSLRVPRNRVRVRRYDMLAKIISMVRRR